MSTEDQAWDELVSDWQGDVECNHALDRVYRQVRRNSSVMILTVCGEVLLTLGLLALSVQRLRGAIEVVDVVWLFALWLFWAIAVRFAVTNRRGTWGAFGYSTLRYLDLSIERAKRQIRTSRFVIGLTTAQLMLAFMLSLWFRAARGLSTASLLLNMLVFAGVGICYTTWGLWYGRRARRRLSELEDLLDQMS